MQTPDIGKITLLGIIFVSFIALFLNFLFPLNIYLNTIILCLTFFLFFTDRKKFFSKKLIKYNFVIAIISTLLLVYANINRPDAALYHLPYVSFLNEHKIIMGLGNIHSRFGHISIIQYLSAINYNFLFGLNGINIPLAVIVSTFIVFFYRQVLMCHKYKLLNLDFYFCLFVSIYILYKINRYSSFGNDAVTHLSFFYLIRLILNDNKFKELPLIILLCVFIFLNKNTYLFIFLFPIIIYFYNKIYLDYKKTLRHIFSFSTFFLFLWCLKNIFISGCLIYPIHQTCIKELKWTANIEDIKNDAQAGEAWSKGWPQNKIKKLEVQEFNNNFNWLKAWLSVHGKYVGKTLFPYLFFIIILNFYFRDKKKTITKKTYNINYSLCLGLTAILTFIFFIKFPLYRYGYSYLISLIILLNLYNFGQFNLNKVVNFTRMILIIFPFLFLGKQSQRYYEKYPLNYINKPWPNIYSLNNNEISKKKLAVRFKELEIFNSNGECGYSNAVCTNYEIKNNINVNKKFTYYIISDINKK